MKVGENLGLMLAKTNPYSLSAGIAVGILDATGVSDKIYESIDNGANSFKKQF